MLTGTVVLTAEDTDLTTAHDSAEREITRRRHISQPQYKLIWEYLDATFGHRCFFKGCPRLDIQVDHKDGDRNNTTLTNLQPACPKHQQVRAVARRKGREGRREASAPVSTNADSSPTESYEIRAHRAEGPFRSWVLGKLIFNGGGPLPASWFTTNGAEIFQIMPITTGRYLEKMYSDSGPLEKEPGEINKRTELFVRVKPQFWSTAARGKGAEN